MKLELKTASVFYGAGNLRSVLDEIGLKQFDLACDVGCSAAFISDFLAGKRMASQSMADKIGKAIAQRIKEYDAVMKVRGKR